MAPPAARWSAAGLFANAAALTVMRAAAGIRPARATQPPTGPQSPGVLATLTSLRIIAVIGQLSCFPGSLSPFPGSDNQRTIWRESEIVQVTQMPISHIMSIRPLHITSDESSLTFLLATAPPSGFGCRAVLFARRDRGAGSRLSDRRGASPRCRIKGHPPTLEASDAAWRSPRTRALHVHQPIVC